MKEPWIKEEEFWVSPFNYAEDVRDLPYMPERVLLHDTTLRDGEQTSGVVFRMEQKVEIAKFLDNIGVSRIEAGSPMVSEEDAKIVKAIAELGLKAEICALARAMGQDIDLAVDCGVGRIVMEIPLGLPRLKYQYAKWSEDDTISKTLRGLEYACIKNIKTTLFMMDTARAEFRFLEKVVTAVSKAGTAGTIAVVDTSGALLPSATVFLIRLIRSLTDIPLEIHTHNDMGLGLANTLAAIENGVSIAHVCVNGLGERTGNVALDELVMSLYCLYGLDIGVNRSRLTELARFVEKQSGISPALNKPVTGKRVFCRESGLGIDLLQKAPLAIFSLNPSVVGQKARVVLGKKSGIASIDFMLDKMGKKSLPEDIRRKLLGMVKELGISKGGLVTEEEFAAMIEEVVG
jgi:methanogen homocitrate synthase